MRPLAAVLFVFVVGCAPNIEELSPPNFSPLVKFKNLPDGSLRTVRIQIFVPHDGGHHGPWDSFMFANDTSTASYSAFHRRERDWRYPEVSVFAFRDEEGDKIPVTVSEIRSLIADVAAVDSAADGGVDVYGYVSLSLMATVPDTIV